MPRPKKTPEEQTIRKIVRFEQHRVKQIQSIADKTNRSFAAIVRYLVESTTNMYTNEVIITDLNFWVDELQ